MSDYIHIFVPKSLKTLYKKNDPIIFWSHTSSIFFILLTLIFITSTYTLLPEELPLFYSLPWGENQLAQKNQFLLLPTIILLILLTNLFLSWHLHKSQLFIKRLLAGFTTLMALLLTLTTFKIIVIFI